MPNAIATQLAELPNLNRATLYKLWEQFFASPPHPQLRRTLMLSILAHRIQEQAFGSLSGGTRGRLRQLARAFETNRDASLTTAPRLHPGTRLLREWRGQVHMVNVHANGYEYRRVIYQSLSEIARLITGTRWSGPLFFGIHGDPPKSSSKEVR